MRRKDREVTDPGEIMKIIDACEVVRLGLSDGAYPYIVPVNFACRADGEEIALYFHGAMAGKKYELLKKNPVCSFEMDIPLGIECIYDKKDVTMRYRCVMGKAEAEFLEGEEKQYAIDHIIMARHEETKNFAYNKSAAARTAVVKLRVTELTAKQNLPGGGAD